MTNERRFVLDTNTIVSAALLKTSVSRQAFDLAQTQGQVLLSVAILEELNTVLKRDKFNKYVTEEERFEFLAAFVQHASLIEPDISITDCRDPKDNKFLELAVSGHADAIISGDDDLAVLHPYRGILILSPRLFLEHHWPSTAE